MGKITALITRAVTVALFFNALLVLLQPALKKKVLLRFLTAIDGSNADLSNSTCACRREQRSSAYDKEEALIIDTVLNYSEVAAKIPRIGAIPPFSFTRLGTQLKFNPTLQCPKGSVVLDSAQLNAIPPHLDCPTLFIVGARKGGTTSLYHYLNMHPHFAGINIDKGPASGETFYFSAHFDNEEWKWENYVHLFRSAKGQMTGDSSVGNFVNCKVPARIWRSCGKQARIVILLRDPVKRFFSNFLMRTRLGIRAFGNKTNVQTVVNVETESYFHAVRKIGAVFSNITTSWPKFRCLFSPSRNMVFEGLYYVHIMNWLCNFPPENIIILNSEEFFANTTLILNQVIRFLGLESLDPDKADLITSTIYNKGSGAAYGYQHPNIVDLKKLRYMYRNANRALAQLLGWEDVQWNI